MNDKKLEKLETKLLKDISEEELNLLKSKTNEELEKSIADLSCFIQKQTQEKEENVEYIKAKEIVKDFDSALNEAIKYQKLTLQYLTILLSERSN